MILIAFRRQTLLLWLPAGMALASTALPKTITNKQQI